MKIYFCSDVTIMDKFNLEIKQNELYSENSKTVDALIQDMVTRKIAFVGQFR